MPPNLEQFKLGVVVALTLGSKNKEDVGHVMGFGVNMCNEVVISVKLAKEEKPREIHPGNLLIL